MDKVLNSQVAITSQFDDVPTEILVEIIHNSELESLGHFALANTEFMKIVSKPYVLDKIAETHGLPYSKSLNQLIEYFKLDVSDLFVIAVNECNIRVIMITIGKCEVMFIHNTIVNALVNMISGERLTAHVVDTFLEIDSCFRGNILSAAIRLNLPDIVDMLVLPESEYLGQLMEHALEFDNVLIVEHLLDLGSTDYEIALWLAARDGRLYIVNRIIKAGPDVDALNNGLLGAASVGDIKMLNLFIDNGADDHAGAIATAAGYGQLELFTTLVDCNTESDVMERALLYASRSGMLNIITKIIDIGVNDKCITTSMLEVVIMDRLDSFNMLLCKAKPQFDYQDIDRLLKIFIRRAAQICSPVICNRLKEIDHTLVNEVDSELMSAVEKGEIYIVRNVYSVGPSIEAIRKALAFGMIRYFKQVKLERYLSTHLAVTLSTMHLYVTVPVVKTLSEDYLKLLLTTSHNNGI